ncbi:hypothetical protein [Sinomonas flava]|uniref:DUF4307 domain-containing protein n=1 Tax=Sinomonas flava TaxID=496857 RepID=A0ABN3BJG9_9MICC
MSAIPDISTAGPEEAGNTEPFHSSASVGEQHAATPPEHRRRWVRQVAIGAGGMVLGVLLGVGFAQIKLPGSTPFPAALEKCEVTDSSYFRTGDEGMSLTIRSKGKEDPGANMTDVACVLRALEVPDSVVSKMDSTRALDGRQSGRWKNLEASWTYHPDSGMNLLLEVTHD